MKGLLSLFALLTIVLAPFHATSLAQEKKRYVRYAEFVTDSEVQVSDGSIWMMEKGDCFPIHMFKDQQTRVILQLADATFSTPAYRVQVLRETEEKRAAGAYQKMVDNFLKSKARQRSAEMSKKKP